MYALRIIDDGAVRRVLILAGVCLCAVFAPRASFAADEVDAQRLDKITAVFLLNFARYTEWPQERFEDDAAPVSIAVVGRSGVTEFLEQLAIEERVAERPLRVTTIDPPKLDDPSAAEAERVRFRAAVGRAHLVFVPDERPDRDRVALLVASAAESHVVTVGRGAAFVDRGGMLGLYVVEGRVVFDANVEAFEAAGLRMSSKALRLAQRVKEAKR